MSHLDDLLMWLRDTCSAYEVEPVAVYRRHGEHDWPLHAIDAEDLATQLAGGGHFLPLPKESASLANVIEVSIVDFLLKEARARTDIELERGTERGYPDLEISGPGFGAKYYAVDVKVARRKASKMER